MCLEIIAIVLSIVSLILTLAQNRKLHRENSTLQVIPSINLELLEQEKIRGHSEKRSQNTLDEINIFVTRYTDLYTDQDLILGDREKSKDKFTLVIENDGSGPAKDIVIKAIVIRTANSKITYNKDNILFSCSASSKKAIKIFSDLSLDNLAEIEIEVSYKDILGKVYTDSYSFAPLNNDFPEMKITKHTQKVNK